VIDGREWPQAKASRGAVTRLRDGEIDMSLVVRTRSAFLAVAAMGLSAFAATQPAHAIVYTNLLVNGGFEADTALNPPLGWANGIAGPAGATGESGVAHSGSNALLSITPPSPQFNVTYQDQGNIEGSTVVIQPDTTYEFSAFVYHPSTDPMTYNGTNGGSFASFELEWYDSVNETFLGEEVVFPVLQEGVATDEWIPISGTGIAPMFSQFGVDFFGDIARVVLGTYQPAGTASGRAYYDDVRFGISRVEGDVNESDLVDIFDVGLVSDEWMTDGAEGGDANLDGSVDIFDVGVISDHWMESPGGGAASVPEPSSAALAFLAVASAILWRRRLW
jgi:hypothetical protein